MQREEKSTLQLRHFRGWRPLERRRKLPAISRLFLARAPRARGGPPINREKEHAAALLAHLPSMATTRRVAFVVDIATLSASAPADAGADSPAGMEAPAIGPGDVATVMGRVLLHARRELLEYHLQHPPPLTPHDRPLPPQPLRAQGIAPVTCRHDIRYGGPAVEAARPRP